MPQWERGSDGAANAMSCDPLPGENQPPRRDPFDGMCKDVNVVIHHDSCLDGRKPWFTVTNSLQNDLPFASRKRGLTAMVAPREEHGRTGYLAVGNVVTGREPGVHFPR